MKLLKGAFPALLANISGHLSMIVIYEWLLELERLSFARLSRIKPGTYSRVEHLRSASPVLLTYIRLGYVGLLGMKTSL